MGNDHLDDDIKLRNLQLINTQDIQIHNYMTTTQFKTTNKADEPNEIISHFKQYMVMYIVIGAVIIMLCVLAVLYWKTKHLAKEVSDDEDDAENIGIVKGYSAETNGRYTAKKWQEVDQEDAEYMMKAFDDDEALQNFYKASDSDDIEMTNGHYAG